MSTVSPTYQQAPVSSKKMLQAMVGIGAMCALLIVATYEGTLPRIERLKSESLEQAIFKVLPGTTKKLTFQLEADGTIGTLSGQEPVGPTIHAGYNQDYELVGLAIEASGMGFADVLRILYGYDPQTQTIIGFHVLESKETPGLGDKIEKDAVFLSNFEALDVALNSEGTALENAVVYVKKGSKKNAWEVDGITGATISSKAIGEIIGESTGNIVPVIYNNQESFVLQSEQLMNNEH